MKGTLKRRPKSSGTHPAPPVVCFLTSSVRRPVFGRDAAALARGFRELDTRLDIVSVEDDPVAPRDDGVVRNIGLGVRPRSAAIPIARYLWNARPRITFAKPAKVAVPALCAARITRSAMVPWEGAFVARELRGSGAPPHIRLLPLWRRLTYRWAAGIAANSENLAAWIEDLPLSRGHGSVHRLYNPIDLEGIRSRSREAAEINSGGLLLCTAGRLVESKGYDVLLDALRLRCDDLPDGWTLAMLGDGETRAELEARRDRHGLQAKVRFLGYRDNPYPVMRAADIFVHPARYEAFGAVLVEALALGTPIVSTDCQGGPPEILGSGRYGRVVTPDDPAALGEALVALAHDPTERARLARIAPGRAREYSPTPMAAARRMLEIGDSVERSGGSAVNRHTET